MADDIGLPKLTIPQGISCAIDPNSESTCRFFVEAPKGCTSVLSFQLISTKKSFNVTYLRRQCQADGYMLIFKRQPGKLKMDRIALKFCEGKLGSREKLTNGYFASSTQYIVEVEYSLREKKATNVKPPAFAAPDLFLGNVMSGSIEEAYGKAMINAMRTFASVRGKEEVAKLLGLETKPAEAAASGAPTGSELPKDAKEKAPIESEVACDENVDVYDEEDGEDTLTYVNNTSSDT